MSPSTSTSAHHKWCFSLLYYFINSYRCVYIAVSAGQKTRGNQERRTYCMQNALRIIVAFIHRFVRTAWSNTHKVHRCNMCKMKACKLCWHSILKDYMGFMLLSDWYVDFSFGIQAEFTQSFRKEWTFIMYDRYKQSNICDGDDPWRVFVKVHKRVLLKTAHKNMKDKQYATYHGEHTILQRTGWIGQDREQSFLSALPDGHLRCCETSELALVQTTGATAISVPRETGLSVVVYR